MKEYLAAGEFVTTHGILGEIKLYPWTDSAAFVCALPRLFFSISGGKSVRILGAREHKGMCLLTLEGVSTVEQAHSYVGKTVYFARSDVKLPKGKYFVEDIIGCTVQNADTGAIYGKVTAVQHPAAHDVYTVQNSKGAVFLFPAVPEFLVSLQPENALVTVRPIPGMFDDAENVDAEAEKLAENEEK